MKEKNFFVNNVLDKYMQALYNSLKR